MPKSPSSLVVHLTLSTIIHNNPEQFLDFYKGHMQRLLEKIGDSTGNASAATKLAESGIM